MRARMRALLLSLAISTGAASAAGAACVQRDLRGTWDLYSTENVFLEEENALLTTWTVCVLRINADGVIQAGSNCQTALEEQLTINGGRLAVRSSCRARGRIDVELDSVVVRLQVTQATLTADKGLLVGVGRDAILGIPFIFQAVRR